MIRLKKQQLTIISEVFILHNQSFITLIYFLQEHKGLVNYDILFHKINKKMKVMNYIT